MWATVGGNFFCGNVHAEVREQSWMTFNSYIVLVASDNLILGPLTPTLVRQLVKDCYRPGGESSVDRGI